MRRLVAVFALFLLMSFQPKTLASSNIYIIDNDHTHVVWRVSRFGFTDTIGTFVDVSGSLKFNPKSLIDSSVEVSIPLAGLRSDLLEREDIVRGRFWLNATEFPEIKFESTKVVLIETPDCLNICLLIQGNMFFKDMSVPIELTATLNKQGRDPVSKKNAIGFSAKGQFRRSEFAIMTALGPIGDDVRFEIELLAIEGE